MRPRFIPISSSPIQPCCLFNLPEFCNSTVFSNLKIIASFIHCTYKSPGNEVIIHEKKKLKSSPIQNFTT